MGFSPQEYWSELPFPLPGALPHPMMEAVSPALAGGFFTTQPPGKPLTKYNSLLQGIFLTQGSNLGLVHCILYRLSHHLGSVLLKQKISNLNSF